MSSRRWGEELLQVACSLLAEEMTLDPSAPGGMVTYRRTLTLSLFYKFYLTVLQKLRKQVSQLLFEPKLFYSGYNQSKTKLLFTTFFKLLKFQSRGWKMQLLS